MTLSPNQFAQDTAQGQSDLPDFGNVLSAQVDTAQAVDLVAGQYIKLATTAGGVPKVLALAADTESPFGVVLRNFKDASYSAGDSLEIGMATTVVWMTAGATIARGAKVQTVIASNKVITNAGTNPVTGFALDAASADGSLFRVLVLAPAYGGAQVIADVAGLQAALDDLDSSIATVATAQVDVATSTTLVDVTGCAVDLVAGEKYVIEGKITGVATVNGGAKAALVSDGTLTATSFTCTGKNYNDETLNAASTTTTLGTAVAGDDAVMTDLEISAAIVVNVGGELNLQIAQNSSHADTTSAYVNSTLKATRVV